MIATPKFVFGSVENIEGNWENASYKHFLLFPQCFIPYRSKITPFEPH